MALEKCAECDGKVSSKADACPHCGAKPKRSVMNKNIGCAPVVLFGLLGLFIYSLITEPASKSTPRVFGESEALVQCQYQIKLLMKDPEKSKAPYVEGYESNGTITFSWGRSTKFVRARNGLGNDVPVSASCSVSLSSERISSLTLNGKQIL